MLCFFWQTCQVVCFSSLGAGHSVQHYSALNSCSLHRSLFTPSCFHLPSLYSFSSHFPFYTDHWANFFSCFSTLHFTCPLFLPPQLHSSNPHRVVSISISQYVSPTWRIILLHSFSFLCFCESFLLCRHFCCCCCTSWSQNRSRRFGAGGGGSRAQAPSLHRHIHIYTNTTQTLHYTKTDSQTRSASSICLDGGSGFLVVVVLVKEKRKGEKGNTANRTTKSTTTTTGTWCTAFCLRYSFCLLSFFFFFSFSIYLPTATTAAKAEAPLSGAHSFYVFPFFSLSFTK